jgi:hypothetical protein
MDIRLFLIELREFVSNTFAEVDTWFDQPAALRAYPPADGGWTIDEILNHIGLTNHYLLILIEKGAAKALANAQHLDLAAELAHYNFPRRQLATIGVLHGFNWGRPAHMEPRDHPRPLPTVRQQLHAQLAQALACLDRLPHGEGLLYRTTMTVNGLGKLNVYEYVYFLAQHARRHLTQMQDNAAEFAARVA